MTPRGGGHSRSRARSRQRLMVNPALRRRQRATVATVLLLALVGALFVVYSVSATSGGTSTGTTATTTAPTTTPAKPPTEVSPEAQMSFVDRCGSCATENFVTGASTPGRTLVTDIWYPALGSSTTPASTDGSAPLVVLAHGYDLQPTDYLPLIDTWVRAGYVVAAPVFPDTNTASVALVLRSFPDPGTDDPHHSPENDVVNQPADLAFVLGQLVADEQAADGGGHALLHGLFDPNKIGVAGQSDGGDTVAALFYDSCCRAALNVHVAAVAVLSGAENSGWFPGTWFSATGPPVLVVQGTADACNSPPLSDTLYDAAPASLQKYFVVVLGADHLQPYAQPGAFSTEVGAVTTKFFDAYLGHGSASPAQLLAAGTSPVTTITDAGTAPALHAVTATWSYNPGTSLDPCSVAFTGPPAPTTTTTTVGTSTPASNT